jgi:hypothetical protein
MIGRGFSDLKYRATPSLLCPPHGRGRTCTEVTKREELGEGEVRGKRKIDIICCSWYRVEI